MTSARILLTVALLAGTVAQAEPKHAAAAAQARELYKKGMTHYQLGDFDTAIDEFKAAYELTNAPGLLFNLAQVQRMKKDWVQALHFYRMYLRLEPTAANRADVEALIDECQRAQDEVERARQPKVEPVPAPVTPPPAVTTAPIVAPPPPPPPRRWRTKLWIAGAAAVVGLGAIGAAIPLHLRANDDADVLARDSMVGTNAWDGTRQALYADGQNAANAAIALDVVGAVLVAAGVVVGVLGLRERAQAKRFSLAPSGRGTVFACEF